ncbi:MAG TPA: ABC transporter substrate-binding protein [Pilimelia sp.]|nr:ABC transporter substrate-binding protein [Pilimelia sp.]
MSSFPRSTGRVAVAAVALALLAAGCSSKAQTSGTSGNGPLKVDVGVTDTVIKLGVLTDRTGPFAPASKAAEQGRTLFWEQQGKICNRTVEFVTKDHKYTTTGASAAYAEIRDEVLALDELLGTPIIYALQKDIEADQMTTMAASFGSDLLVNPNIVIVGATYDIEMINAVGYLVKAKGLVKGDKIGHIYHEGPYGANAAAGSKAAATNAGLVLVEQKIKPTDADLTAQVTALKAAGVKAVLLTTSSAQTGNAVSVATTSGFDVTFLGSNPTFSGALLAGPAKDAVLKSFLVVASVAPFGAPESGPTKVREAFKAKYPNDPKSQFVLYGYAQQQIMASALKAACDGGDLTRAGLAKAIQSLSSVQTDGLLPALDYSTKGGIPTRETRILRPTAGVEGGLEQVAELATDPFATSYQPAKS